MTTIIFNKLTDIKYANKQLFYLSIFILYLSFILLKNMTILAKY